MKFEWFFGIYKQNCNKFETTESIKHLQACTNFFGSRSNKNIRFRKFTMSQRQQKKKHLLKQTKHWDKPVLEIWMVAIIDIGALKT